MDDASASPPASIARRDRVLLVEPDFRLVETLVPALVERFDVDITCVGDPEDAIDADLDDAHDLVVAELDMFGLCGIQLTRMLNEPRRRPVILIGETPTRSQTIEAMRAGVCDFYAKPIPVEALLASAAMLLGDARRRALDVHRHSQLRQLIRRVIHQRRDLNQRLELVCRDLVGAHRRLVDKVVELDKRSA